VKHYEPLTEQHGVLEKLNL